MNNIRHILRRWFPYLGDSAVFFLGMLVPIGTTVLLCVMVVSCARASEGRWVMAEVTAYCPCEECCHGSADGITADGTRTSDVPYGIAASRQLALGSVVRIPVGHGYLDESRPMARDFRVDDRGAALDSEYSDGRILRLDLRYRTHWSAKQFGRKLMLVFIAN